MHLLPGLLHRYLDASGWPATVWQPVCGNRRGSLPLMCVSQEDGYDIVQYECKLVLVVVVGVLQWVPRLLAAVGGWRSPEPGETVNPSFPRWDLMRICFQGVRCAPRYPTNPYVLAQYHDPQQPLGNLEAQVEDTHAMRDVTCYSIFGVCHSALCLSPCYLPR